jgi:hypothetical protein
LNQLEIVLIPAAVPYPAPCLAAERRDNVEIVIGFRGGSASLSQLRKRN